METIIILTCVAILQSPSLLQYLRLPGISANTTIFFRRLLSISIMIPSLMTSSYQINWQLSLPEMLVLMVITDIVLRTIPVVKQLDREAGSNQMQVYLTAQPFYIHAANVISWTVYLTCYELMVRSLLINELCAAGFNYPAALFTGLLVYVIMHLPQGTRLTLAAIPFGMVAAVWLYFSSSILPVILLHLVCALGFDYLSVSNNRINNLVKYFKWWYCLSGRIK